MKIISVEPANDDIEYALKKEILIPCWVYKIPIEISRDGELNFIEKTILDLIKIDDSLKDNPNRLSKMLGFCSDKEQDDKTQIIKLILQKIKHLRLDESGHNDETNDSEVKIYQFYQEAYSFELLPIITSNINEFSYSETNKKYHENEYRKISFKKHISSSKILKSILVDRFDENPNKPTQTEILETIYLHNQKNYDGSHKIDYKNFKIDAVDHKELVYLHTKLYIPTNSVKSIVMTNGFTNNFSTLLRKVYEKEHHDLLRIFRQELRQDIDIQKNYSVNIPFEMGTRKYVEITKLIEEVEKDTLVLDSKDSSKGEIKKAKDSLTQSLYDVLEKSFAVLAKDLKDNKSLKNKKLLQTLSKDVGFHTNTRKPLEVFKVDSRENLQKYLAKTLVHKKDELYEISLNYPYFLFEISKLLKYRNGLKHSSKEDILLKIDTKDIRKSKDIIYKTISIILKIKQKSVTQHQVDSDDDIYYQNAYIDLECELPLDIMEQLSQEVKDYLVSINFYLNENDFDTNRYNIVKEVVNQLYSALEYIFRKHLDTLYLEKSFTATSKEELLERIREKVEIGERLYRVSPAMLEKAQKKQNASLGAYFLVYLYRNKNVDQQEVNLLQDILTLRKHGSPEMEDVENITINELRELKNKSFKYIEKLIGEFQ